MLKRAVYVFAAVLLALTLCVPALAGNERHATPAGYNDHDYQKIAAFFDTQITVSYYGITMTKHLYEWAQMIEPGFSMQDPSTWHVEYEGATQFDVEWTGIGGEYRLTAVTADPSITWFTDYTGCDLDLSGCGELVTLVCSVFRIGSLDVSDCGKLVTLVCRNNDHTTSVDLSGCSSLASADLTGCRLTEIDFSDSPLIPFDHIGANGSGTVGYAAGTAYAVPNSGSQFFGWYSESGQLITQSSGLDASSTDFARVSARFTGAVTVIMGDANGDGSVDVQDALMALRAGMSMISLSPDAAAACDVNGDGSVTVGDALQILRKAMGLIQQF